MAVQHSTWWGWYESLYDAAAEVCASIDDVRKLINRVIRKRPRARYAFSTEDLESLRWLLRLLEEWRNGRFRLGTGKVLLIVAGLLYFLMPLDAVPDVVPLVGYVDDLTVLAGVVAQLEPVLARLQRRWYAR